MDFHNFDWRGYLSRNGLGQMSRIEAIMHFSKNNQFTLKISKLPDHQLVFTQKSQVAKLPNGVDLRSKLPACYDQGQLGSCTANALVGAYQFLYPSFMGSRLFLYYNERAIEGDIPHDSGAYVHDGVYSLQKSGLCPETMWAYTLSKFAVKPPASAYTEALKHRVFKVFNVRQTLADMKGYLTAGFPFVVGISVYLSFLTTHVSNTGLIPMPPVNKKDTLQGGHCVLVVGFDDTVTCPGSPPGSFLLRNSWGTSWGIKGYAWVPYGYLLSPKLCSDNWCLEG